MQHALDLARPYAPLILALVVWPIVGAALSWWLWWDTPEHWEAYAKAHPGRALAIRALRTVSPHLRKLVIAWREYAAARSSLPPLAVVTEKTGALAVSETRPSVAPAAPTPAEGVDVVGVARQTVVPPPPGGAHPSQVLAPRFDATARQTIAPEVVDAARASVDQRGSVDFGSLLFAAWMLAVVFGVGLGLMGCPASQQLTRPALGAVDGCEPRATRCSPTGRPQVCSGSRRWTDADVACVTAGQVAAVCCLTRSPITGRELHACVLAERCIAQDGGL